MFPGFKRRSSPPTCSTGRWLERTNLAADIGDLVQQIVTRLLSEGHPDIHSVAGMLRLSTRTLQRRLSDEGLTFARVVVRARFDVAQRMLDDPARKVIDVALDLGYSDPAHFTRAFVRWTGLGPSAFRQLRSTGSARHRLRTTARGRASLTDGVSDQTSDGIEIAG
jgi:AraC-like DNA-binding protein